MSSITIDIIKTILLHSDTAKTETFLSFLAKNCFRNDQFSSLNKCQGHFRVNRRDVYNCTTFSEFSVKGYLWMVMDASSSQIRG